MTPEPLAELIAKLRDRPCGFEYLVLQLCDRAEAMALESTARHERLLGEIARNDMLRARLQEVERKRDEAKASREVIRQQAETMRDNWLAARAEVERLTRLAEQHSDARIAEYNRAESAERRLASMEKVVEAARPGAALYEGRCTECHNEPDICPLVKCGMGPIRKALSAIDATKETT